MGYLANINNHDQRLVGCYNKSHHAHRQTCNMTVFALNETRCN